MNTESNKIYNWAFVELAKAKKVEEVFDIDTYDLKLQIIQLLQEDLYKYRNGDDLTI